MAYFKKKQIHGQPKNPKYTNNYAELIVDILKKEFLKCLNRYLFLLYSRAHCL